MNNLHYVKIQKNYYYILRKYVKIYYFLIFNFLLIYYVFRVCLSIRRKNVTTIYGKGKKTNMDGGKRMGIFIKVFF